MFIARLFFVFNLDQVDDMAGSEGAKARLLSRAYGFRATEFDPIAEAEALVARSGAVVKLGGQAAYSPDLDIITMPPRMAFPKGAETYYPTLFHELGHWTGHDSRLARDLKRFDKDRYAVEELVAEMTAAFLSARLGLEVVSQSAAYLGFWVKALKANPSILTTAASAAQKASDYLLPRADTAETEEETAETMAA
jgi:antirestriction protein ArdC